MFYVLTPNKGEYQMYEREHIRIVDVPAFYKINLFFLALYYRAFPALMKSLSIDLVFNFADVVIPTKIKQIYFFDWAYAVYDEKYIWTRMSRTDFLVRKTKVYLIDRYIQQVETVICQTHNMANRLQKKYAIKDLLIIPTPVGIEFKEPSKPRDFVLSAGKTLFLFPAGYASHKNFDVLIPLAELIQKKKLPYEVVLTIDEKIADSFLSKIAEKEVNCIRNVGTVRREHMPGLYKACDVVLLPTLLESFGLPYVEAMAYGKPIITSDLDFAHDVCGRDAIYFNPFDAESILLAMQAVSAEKASSVSGLEKVSKKEYPNWDQVFFQFQEKIEQLVK
ncbi:MAG: hypothetical protein K0R51_805 [Cytophagaceae bacterium]|nr:hypothetical protein [Cytophagaceae bacterium]